MHSAYRITFILFLCLGLALEQSYAKTVTSHTGPCKGENCPLEHSLDASAEGGQNQVENMAQEPGRKTEEHAEKTKEQNNGDTKTEPMEDIPGGRPEEVGSEKTESSLPPPLEKEHGTESNQEHGELKEPEATSTGNTEERPPEAKNEEEEPKQESHRIDPEAVPHGNDDGHVVQETEAQSGNGGHEISRLEPSPEKELHGGVEDVHSGAPDRHGEEEEENPDSGKKEEEESGPDLDAVLHGGDRHAPAPVNDNPDTDSRGEFGVDPERVMHPEGGGAHVHAQARRGPAHRGLVHSDSAPHRDPAHRDSAHTDKDPDGSDGRHDYATDIESVLHGGDKHVHAPDARIQDDDDDDDLPEVPVGATDLEAMVHGGDGHAHSQPRPDTRTDPEPRPYGAQDPESVLHGSDDHEHRIRQEAVDGSRPMPSRTDPDTSPTDVDPEDVRIGTMRPEDGDDYRQWKAEKERDASSSWFSGFTYLKEGFWRDLRAAKDRYLARLWSGEGGTDEGKPARAPHDEP